MSLPKVLIIGQPFNNNSGGGITQANLFGGWDKDKIAVVCTSHMFNNLNNDICDTYYLLGNDEYKWVFPFNLIQRKTPSGGVKLNDSNSITNAATPTGNTKPSLRKRMVDDYFYPFLEYAGLFHCISKIQLSPRLKQWLDDYKPDVIYAQASSRETIFFCIAMQEYINKPMVFHMMDDWPSTISEKGPFKNFWRKVIDKNFRQLLSRCTVLLSISDYMGEEYKRRYGKDSITFHNPIDLNFWKSFQRTQYQLGTSPRLLYAGRIGLGIQASLESIAQAIDNMNKRDGKQVQFVLQTELKPEWTDQYACVKHQSLVPYKELPKVFAEADMLVLPYDFSDESIRFIKYSMPTKAPEYMVCGTPVIVYAPEVTAIVKDAEKNKWAKLVTVNNVDTLSQAIKEVVDSEEERKQIAQAAIGIAETKFNSVTVRSRFKDVLASVVQ
ncbi:MAG: glycosyltransferase [Bacteroidetes bacterium]|nr:glycosyltransferase [Bacteroidota bacterium]